MQEIVDNVWRLCSPAPGPTLAIIGGVHGNEIAGIRLVKKLKQLFEQGELELVSGTLYLGLGNPQAIALGERNSSNTDLNRSFTTTVLSGAGSNYEYKRARELAAVLGSVDIGLDVHSTNKPSEPFAATCESPPTRMQQKLLQLLQISTIVTDPHYILASEPATLDTFLCQNGTGLCWETGQASNTACLDRLLDRILAVLSFFGLINSHPCIREHLVNSLRVLKLRNTIAMAGTGFEYANGFGSYNFQEVLAGDVIGRERGRDVVSKQESVIVFPKPEKLWQNGKPIGYLAYE